MLTARQLDPRKLPKSLHMRELQSRAKTRSVTTRVMMSASVQLPDVVAEMLQPSNLEAAVLRYELSNKEWSIIRMVLPTKPRGVPRVDDRRVVNGIFWGRCRNLRQRPLLTDIRSVD